MKFFGHSSHNPERYERSPAAQPMSNTTLGNPPPALTWGVIFFFMGLLLLSSIGWAQSGSAAMITKVIDLHYIQAETLIPQLKPLLAQGETISGSGNTLILRVSPDTLTQLRLIIHKTDIPPVVFNISIHQGSSDWLDGQKEKDTVYGTRANSESGNTQSVNVMSGQTAFVSIGSERPVISAVSGGFYPGVSYQQQQEKQGFFVEPTLQGQEVKISIKRIRQQADAVNQQASENQSLATATMIPLDKWVMLGDASQGSTVSQPDATSYQAGNSFTNEAVLFIKISVAR